MAKQNITKSRKFAEGIFVASVYLATTGLLLYHGLVPVAAVTLTLGALSVLKA